jgi:hypothetical protein
MGHASDMSRREVLAGSCGLLLAGGLAGCAGDGDEDGQPTTTTATTRRPSTDASGAPTTQAPSPTDEGTADGRTTTDPETDPGDDLDRREANVVGVAVEPVDGGYRFDVSLHHDDEGEAGYADWWQVETIRGERMGRRDLAHPHSTQPFTRSTTIDVPSGLSCVVVRGHDQTHGYGGRAMILNLESGATRVVDQGPDAQQFAASDCP